jgi:acyl carrier protein
MAQTVTRDAVQEWLVDRLAATLGVDAAKVDVHEPFASYALDSVAAVRLVGELEELLGRELEPTLLYDHRDIERLSEYLDSL